MTGYTPRETDPRPQAGTERERALLARIVRDAARIHGVAEAAITSYSRLAPVVVARDAVLHALSARGWSQTRISRVLGLDRSSVGYGIRRHADRGAAALSCDPAPFLRFPHQAAREAARVAAVPLRFRRARAEATA